MPVLHMMCIARVSNGVWEVLNDSGHSSFNVGTVSVVGNQVQITYGTPITSKVSYGDAHEDETYNAADIRAGASVGLTALKFNLARNGVVLDPLSTDVALNYSNVMVEVWRSS
jgi:hypothetical protein